MSNKLYNQQWQETINDMQDLIQLENSQADPEFLNNQAYELFQFYAQNYIRYIDIYKRLEDCYDQIVHPQKKADLQSMLELVIIRMIENKKSLIAQNKHSANYQSDMVNLDEMIADLKLTPDRLEVPIPRYFRKETDKQRLLEREDFIRKQLIDFHDTDMPEEEVQVQQLIFNPTIDEAIKKIQTFERGRQGIFRSYQYKERKRDLDKKAEKAKKMAGGEEINEDEEKSQATLVLQKYFKGYKGREELYKMRIQEMEFLGIQKKFEDRNNPQSEWAKAEEHRQKMNETLLKHQKDYQTAQVELKKLVQENEGPEIREKKVKERVEWIDQYLDKTEGKKLPQRAIDYYDQKKRFPPTAEELEALKGGKKGAKKEEKKGGDKKGKKGKKDAKEDKKETVNLNTVVKINETVDQYLSTWGSINDAENFQQTYVTEVAKGAIRQNVNEEMNGLVDELIEIELDNRHLFLLKKPRKRPKKPKPPRAPKPKKFKVPGVGACRGKNPFDMLSELIDVGIVKRLMPAQLQDLKGRQNFLGVMQEQAYDIAPDPSLAQLRAALAEFIAMPLGSANLKEKLDKMAYFLFFGPPGSGKTLALRALATECNAMTLDLTPSNIAGRCTDKASIGKTLYMAFAVAKHFHPSIIFMDEIDQVFGSAKKKKGVPAATWAKLKKPLQDFKKQKFIEATSRVAFIGCTNNPLFCVMKDTKNFFEKKFFFPMLNHDTRLMLIQDFIESKGVQLDFTFPLSTLAHITDSYTAGAIKQAIDTVLTPFRIKRLQEDPLKIQEFTLPLSKLPFIKSIDEYKALRTFMDEVTGTKERREKAKQALLDPKKGGKNNKKK